MRMKQLLEGDVVNLHLPNKSSSEMEHHLGKMREHATMAKIHDNLMAENDREKHKTHDEDLRRMHAELSSNHQAAALIHGAIKNHHYRLFKRARDAEDEKRHAMSNQDTSSLSGNAVRLK